MLKSDVYLPQPHSCSQYGEALHSLERHLSRLTKQKVVCFHKNQQWYAVLNGVTLLVDKKHVNAAHANYWSIV